MKIIERTKRRVTVEISKKELNSILGYHVAKLNGFKDQDVVHTHLNISMNVNNDKVKTIVTVTEV